MEPGSSPSLVAVAGSAKLDGVQFVEKARCLAVEPTCVLAQSLALLGRWGR